MRKGKKLESLKKNSKLFNSKELERMIGSGRPKPTLTTKCSNEDCLVIDITKDPEDKKKPPVLARV